MAPDLIQYLQSLPWLSNQAGPSAMVLFGILLVVCEIFVLPITPFDIAAGFAFGFPRAFLVMIASKVLSAGLNYYLARSVARKPAQRLANRFPIVQGLQSAVEKGGWRLAFLFRLCPIPFGLVSYAFGLTKLPSLHHLSATALAVVPPTLAFTVMGASAKAGLESLGNDVPAQNPWGKVFLFVGIAAGIFVIRYVSKIAAQSVKEAQAEGKTPSSQSAPH
ncbi:MAG: VTT domain-containing protein [Verrucomicrobiota bacterium]